ncbi:hypothetical protein IFR05_004027 [Cadophora sp. M221]|nr:hypothetical protein IFR05_004027 [Cadophora sp. M221]
MKLSGVYAMYAMYSLTASFALMGLSNAILDLLAAIAELKIYCTTIGLKYEGISLPVSFDFGECYPYELLAGLAQVAVFCKAATCYNNPNPDCTGGAVPPLPVPIVAGTILPNVADFVQLLGQGATCQRNGLS